MEESAYIVFERADGWDGGDPWSYHLISPSKFVCQPPKYFMEIKVNEPLEIIVC